MKSVIRLEKKGKLSPWYEGTYQILKGISKVAYELEIPTNLASVHLVFYVSLLKKCVRDLTSIVLFECLRVKGSFLYEEVLVEILDHQVRKLRNKEFLT
ncbi:hypothetical protein MTR67_043274 [Solanum verrucosum]|uniref:Tf2-1-like SH3-like domain-containing protein n=1 Tax=Solanum verrucosum TaxID=315347 RepID=A0AAF0URF6_SOLVR|nr:hypothetical protein MTR67_043274 [Solanum verrucosum]